MSSETPPTVKSKQERIRDNQRRSRARRQEYLADLERRLSECHISCREAELQRTAFQDLQAENARLRELLALAGVSQDLIDNYAHQNPFLQTAEVNSVLRQIKPKIHPMESTPIPPPPVNVMPAGPDTSSKCCGGSTTCSFPETNTLDVPITHESSSVSSAHVLAHNPVLAEYGVTLDWLMGHSPSAISSNGIPSQPDATEFQCDTFHIPSNGPLVHGTGNSILCSVAKQMIEQYRIPKQEFEHIKARLAVGFSPPTELGQGCRVNNQVLFSILNDLNAKYPLHPYP